jgi:hypothetical protein
VKTGPEAVPSGGDGLVFFKLTVAARRMLARAPRHRLPVHVTVTDVSGQTATTRLSLVPFSTSGRAPVHSLTPDPMIHPVGMTDFVYAYGAGGILTACDAVYACRISATLSVGRSTIASTNPELVGGRELGYLFFSLTSQGRQMLARSTGNQLGVNLTLRFGADVSRARISLVQFP